MAGTIHMSLVMARAPDCCGCGAVAGAVAVIVMVRMASLLCKPVISFWAPVLRTLTSKLICTLGSAAGWVAAGCGGCCFSICSRAFCMACLIWSKVVTV